MPSLNWIGKEDVVNAHKKVPFRLLNKMDSKSTGKDFKNLVIKGDNLEGIKALMPYYSGKVDLIVIDPPYNTGFEGWVYSDNVNSPKIKKWFKEKTQVKFDDLTRHDKWLCMMYPRLKLLKELLSDNGVIFVNIDDNEQANLKSIMDEIFGERNYEHFVWKKKGGAGNTERIIGTLTEHILCYFKNKKPGIFNYRTMEREYKQKDEIGPYNTEGILKTNKGTYRRETMRFPIKDPKTGEEFLPKENMRWTLGKETTERYIKEGRLYFDHKKRRVYVIKRPEDYEQSDTVYYNLFLEAGSLATAKNELQNLGFDRELFDTPKPVELLKQILKIASKKDSIILDSFAGSGTTGHAVLDLNKEDGGSRNFIMIEMEDKIAEEVTSERIRRAIKKFGYEDGFEFCELGKTLFDESGQIENTCDFDQFAKYIYFTETKTNIDSGQINRNFIGESGGTEYYLIYKEKYQNILNKSFLSKINKNKNKKIVYADRCLVDNDLLKEMNIEFKQIPYEVKIY